MFNIEGGEQLDSTEESKTNNPLYYENFDMNDAESNLFAHLIDYEKLNEATKKRKSEAKPDAVDIDRALESDSVQE